MVVEAVARFAANLTDLDARSIDELRAMDHECAEIETELSYVRRLAQARMDIVQPSLDSEPPSPYMVPANSLVR